MARVKTARTTRARHKKILKQAKGYYGAKSYRFRNANQAVMKSLSYAYVGRKDKKSNFRIILISLNYLIISILILNRVYVFTV